MVMLNLRLNPLKRYNIVLVILLTLIGCKKLKHGQYYEKINGLHLNYTIRGHGPVMLVGHLNSGKIGYELTLKPLEDHFTMVYYEPRGTGKSEAPKTIKAYHRNYIVDEIEALRTHLKVDDIWIFGHSDQSAIALEYALKYPSHTQGLILSGTSLIGSKENMTKRRQNSEDKRSKESAWFAQIIQDREYMVSHNTKTNAKGKYIADVPIKWWCYNEKTAQKVIPLAHKISETGRRKPIHGLYAVESQEERQNYLESQKQFPKIKTKILLINGIYDTNNPPKYVKQLNQVLPNSTLKLIDKAGHFPWIENKTETFKAIKQWVYEL